MSKEDFFASLSGVVDIFDLKRAGVHANIIVCEAQRHEEPSVKRQTHRIKWMGSTDERTFDARGAEVRSTEH